MRSDVHWNIASKSKHWKQAVKIKQIMGHPYHDLLCSHREERNKTMFVLLWTELQDKRTVKSLKNVLCVTTLISMFKAVYTQPHTSRAIDYFSRRNSQSHWELGLGWGMRVWGICTFLYHLIWPIRCICNVSRGCLGDGIVEFLFSLYLSVLWRKKSVEIVLYLHMRYRWVKCLWMYNRCVCFISPSLRP